MTLNELMLQAPGVVKEMGAEFVRRGHASMSADPESQPTGCFLLANRATSLLCGMALLMRPNTRDSYDVLARSFMETRDLLLDFRFDDNKTRHRVKRWFKKKEWSVSYKRCEAFLNHLSGGDLELGKRWGMFSSLAHPTITACRNSTALTVSWITGRKDDFKEAMEAKVADYLMCIGTLIIATTSDFAGWVPLGCDPDRMPNVRTFRDEVRKTVVSTLERADEGSSPRP